MSCSCVFNSWKAVSPNHHPPTGTKWISLKWVLRSVALDVWEDLPPPPPRRPPGITFKSLCYAAAAASQSFTKVGDYAMNARHKSSSQQAGRQAANSQSTLVMNCAYYDAALPHGKHGKCFPPIISFAVGTRLAKCVLLVVDGLHWLFGMPSYHGQISSGLSLFSKKHRRCHSTLLPRFRLSKYSVSSATGALSAEGTAMGLIKRWYLVKQALPTMPLFPASTSIACNSRQY